VIQGRDAKDTRNKEGRIRMRRRKKGRKGDEWIKKIKKEKSLEE
jgi:hypothetical protein